MLSLDSLSRFSCKVQYNHSSTSQFKSGGKIRYLLTPSSARSVIEIINILKKNNIDYITTGNVSNILIKDEGYKGAFLSLKALDGIKKEEDAYYVQPGVNLHKLALIAKDDGLSGLEEISDIPATIGGAIAMNASSYNKSISSLIEYVDVIKDSDVERLYLKDLNMGYRSSKILEEKLTIIGAKLRLKKENTLYINAKMKKYSDLRCSSQPKGISLGSVFKRCNDISAGYYIEKVGLKGFKVGGAMISNKHANFIINVNRAKSRDFLQLAKIAKSEVDKAFKISLEYEVHIV